MDKTSVFCIRQLVLVMVWILQDFKLQEDCIKIARSMIEQMKLEISAWPFSLQACLGQTDWDGLCLLLWWDHLWCISAAQIPLQLVCAPEKKWQHRLSRSLDHSPINMEDLWHIFADLVCDSQVISPRYSQWVWDTKFNIFVL
jgi:hypothetical protein